MDRAELSVRTITVIRSRYGRVLREEAMLVSIDASAITLEGDPGLWKVAEPVVLLRPVEGGMSAAPAVARSVRDGQVTLDVLRAWSPVNRRTAPRYTTRLTASVRDREAGNSTSGRLLDISAGGARVELTRAPTGDGVDLVINALGQQATLPCRVVDSAISGTRFETRLSFTFVFPEDQAFLDSLVHLMGTLDAQGRDLLAS